MPSFRAGYTLADFILRLERSPVTHMSPLYHENRQLFVHRPDVFDKIVMSVSWEKGLALIEAAYYSQKVEVSTYRSLLARMLLHNKLVERQEEQLLGNGARDTTAHSLRPSFHPESAVHAAVTNREGDAQGDSGATAALVDWRAALKVFIEALTAHGNSVPSRMAVSTLRLLAPHGQTTAALRVLRVAEANQKLTKPMLVDGAACCANGGNWSEALRLLTCLHREDPELLTEAIQSLRPPGSDTVMLSVSNPGAYQDATSLYNANGSSEQTGKSAAWGASESTAVPLFPGSSPSLTSPTPSQRHVLRALNEVVSAVPPEVALTNPLCFSYLTHLTASTTLPAEEKARALAAAIRQLPWSTTALLLSVYAEPNLLTDEEWQSATSQLPPPPLAALTTSAGKGPRKKPAGMKRKLKKKVNETVKDARAATETPSTPETGEAFLEGGALSPSPAAAVTAPVAVSAALLCSTLHSRLRLAHCSPATAAAFLAVLISKMPSVRDSWELVLRASGHQGLDDDRSFFFATGSSSEDVNGDASAARPPTFTETALQEAVAIAAQQHAIVRRALLRRCSADALARLPGADTSFDATDSWPVAVAVLLAQGSSHGATPTGVLSPLVLQLRAARQVHLMIRVLLEHIVPTGSKLSESALEAVFECVLAHNRAVHQLQWKTALSLVEGRGDGNGREGSSEPLPARVGDVVHWRSAMSWATDLQASKKEPRITVTGTGDSSGAVERRPRAVLTEEASMSPRLLSLLVSICVDAGSPQGALEVMGRARAADKTELFFSSEIRAVLYCMMYDRPYEAEAIVRKAEEKHGDADAAPLRQLLNLAQSTKLREGAVAAAVEEGEM